MIGLIALLVLLLFFAVGMPVAFAIGGTALVMSIVDRGFSFIMSPGVLAQRTMSGLDNFLLLSVPFFLYSGKIMNVGGITTRLFNFAKYLVGWLRGGLGHVNVMSSVVFAGKAGTAVSDAAALSPILVKAMRDEGYEEDFAVGITCASTIIAPITPPSVPLVIFGMMTGTSIGGLFLGGIIPGLLVAVSLMISVEVYASRRKMPKGIPFALDKIVVAFFKAFPALLTPVIIIGGILSGVFTPTEAASMAAVYATILSVFVYREIGFKDIIRVIKETARDTGTVMIIVSLSNAFGFFITRSGIAVQLANGIIGISTNTIVVGLILIGFLLFVGLFLEATSAIIILSPILLPVAIAGGIDPVVFGIIMVLTLMIGLLTPPFGMVMFVVSKVAHVPLDKVMLAVIPYIIPLLIVCVLLVIFPGLVTFLPSLLL